MKSIEESLAACKNDSIQCAANVFLNETVDVHETYVSSTRVSWSNHESLFMALKLFQDQLFCQSGIPIM